MTTNHLMDILEGKDILTTSDICSFDKESYQYLEQHCNLPGAYFVRQLLERAHKCGYNKICSRYKMDTYEPLYYFEDKIYMVILAVLSIISLILLIFTKDALAALGLIASSCLTMLGILYLYSAGGEPFEETIKTVRYGKIVIRQTELYISDIDEHIKYSNVQKATFSEKTLHLTLAYDYLQIECSSVQDDILSYIVVRCNK